MDLNMLLVEPPLPAWLMGPLGRVIGGMLLLLVGLWLARMLARLLERALGRAQLEPILAGFFSRLAFGACCALILVAALDLLGVPTASLLTVLGAAGLAIGLALRDSLTQLAAGVWLVMLRPFRVGQFVEIAGREGVVDSMRLMHTVLITGDSRELALPNGSVLSSPIVNYSARGRRRIDLTIGIGYSDDIGKALELVRGLLDREARILADPAPTLMVSALADSCVELAVRPWVQTADYWPVRGDLLRAIKECFDEHGVQIPFPQRDVHLISGATALSAPA